MRRFTDRLGKRLSEITDERPAVPMLKVGKVTASGSGVISIQYVGDSTTIANVTCVNFNYAGTSRTLPAINDYVWLLVLPGATPLCIGLKA